MRTKEFIQNTDTALVYAGLGKISNQGRKRLKHLAQTLTLVQNNPGHPIPDTISQQIMQDLRRAGSGGLGE